MPPNQDMESISSQLQSVLLIRHGETEWNCANKRQGWRDSALTSTGKVQMANVCLPINATGPIFTSDLGRAISSAKIIARRYQYPVITLKCLREQKFTASNAQCCPDFWRKNESSAQLQSRVLRGLTQVIDYPSSGPKIIVGHGEWIRMAIAACTPNLDISQVSLPSNGSITQLSISRRTLTALDNSSLMTLALPHQANRGAA